MANLTPKIFKTIEHSRQLCTARYSPCGKFLFAAGYDALVHRWNVSDDAPKLLEPLAGHHGWTQQIAFAGDKLLTADSWGRLIAWKYSEEKPQPIWQNENALSGWIRAVAISPDRKQVAVAGNDPALKVYSIADGKLAGEFGPHPHEVFSAAFHPEGKSLVTGDWRGTLRQWDMANLNRAEAKVPARITELPTFYRLDRIQDCGGIRQLSFDAAGKQLLCAGMINPGGGFAEGAPLVTVVDWASGKITQELQHGDKTQGFAYDAAFHPDGFVMATSCAMPGKGQLWFWKIGETKPFYASTDLPNGRGLSLHPNGKRLALVTVIAANLNGRGKGGKYVDGTAKIQLLDLA